MAQRLVDADRLAHVIEKLRADLGGESIRGETDYRDALRQLDVLEAAIPRVRQELIDAARDDRFTWEKIGSWLGLSRQAMFNRFGGE
jgi:hypothetical protein